MKCCLLLVDVEIDFHLTCNNIIEHIKGIVNTSRHYAYSALLVFEFYQNYEIGPLVLKPNKT